MPDRIVTTHPDTHWHTDPVLYLDPRTTCRVCGGPDLTEVVNLGTQSVSDFTSEPVKSGIECPIVLDLCARCGLVQQRYTAPQDLLYTRHYWYRCIGAQEKLFARVKGWGRYKDRDCLVHDTAEKILSSPYPVELPCVRLDGSVEWRPVLHRESSVRDVYEIEFMTGARVTSSSEHRWPRIDSGMRWRDERLTKDLKPKDRVAVVMDLARPEDAIDHGSIYDEDAGYLVGVFMAEGCSRGNEIRLSVHRFNDKAMLNRVKDYTTGRLYESFRESSGGGNGMEVSINGPVVRGIIKKFVTGTTSHNKRLTAAAWAQPTAFLKGVLDGWLDGDAHNEPNSNRWRFNICQNTDLVEDMALACRIVGYTMRYRFRRGSGFRSTEPKTNQYCGWVRKSRRGMRQKNTLGSLMGTSVSRMWKKPKPKKVWDVSVGGDELYALGCGIVTHNSGVTDTMRAALKDVVAAASARVELNPGDVVLDLGSNDGTLLRHYPPWVVRVGVEPAENLREEGRKGLSFLLSEFWGGGTADTLLRHLGGRKARIVTACGMFYDLEDPNPFVADVAKVLAPDGLFVAQLMCLKQTLDRNDVGNLCHEHLEFYSLRSLETLFARHGLVIREVQENGVNGGSYRLFVTHGEDSPYYSLCESHLCLDEPMTYVIWQVDLERRRAECVRLIKEAKAAGKSVWVYGASTKGNVILQWYGLDHTLLDGAADRSPEKWGRYTVGTGIKITSEEEARQKADVFLVLPYSFRTEFLQREDAWRKRGGRFIFPLPEPEVV